MPLVIDFEKVNKCRAKNNRHSEKYEAVLSFLFRYSNIDCPLSEDLKLLFRLCEGSPVQNTLYNTIIYSLPVELWESSSILERRGLLVNTGAELYHLQRKLNKCIGRTFYVSEVMDSLLIEHIQKEILQRFPFMEDDFREMELDGYDYVGNVFSRYAEIYKQSFSSEPILTDGDSTHFISAIQPYFKNHKERNDHFIQDEKTFWIAVTDKRAKSGVSMFTKEMCDPYGRRLFPTKDDLFVFAIAMKLDYDSFNDLVEKAILDCGDPTRYAYNTANIRDALILSVIRDIDGWYAQIAAELEKDETTRDFVMELLFRVDRMLFRNLCHGQKKPQLENLLYHSFLIDRGDQTYIREFKHWMQVSDSKNILDFQNNVKKAMSKVRKASRYPDLQGSKSSPPLEKDREK